jgi:hypothetical protein
MVKRIASAGVVGFVLLAACGAVCQERQFESLPDAPSAQVGTPTQRFNGFVEETRSPLNFGTMAASAGLTRRDGLVVSEWPASRQKDPDAIFRKYLYASSLNQQQGYHSASGGSLMGRATHAASGIVVARDESGKGRLNTSYLLRALTSVAKDTASTPYWRRSVGEPFSNFGSTVGNDAGRNLWHEFGPGIGRLAKSHMPALVSRIVERTGHK